VQTLDAADECFRNALEIAGEKGMREVVADALYGLARIAKDRGDTVGVRHQGQESLAIFAAIGHHKAGKVKSWLASVP
jgi:hypothetical protein